MSSLLRKWKRKQLFLKKSQLNLFDAAPHTITKPKLAAVHRIGKPRVEHPDLFSFHQEPVTVHASTHHNASGKAWTQQEYRRQQRVNDKRNLPKGTSVYYKTPEMERKKKGTIISGDHQTGYKIKPNREGYNLNPAPVYAPREHIFTQQEHGFKLIRREKLTPQKSIERKQAAETHSNISEADLLKHPTFVNSMKSSLGGMAAKNGFNPNYQNINGVLLNDDPNANELYSEYVTAAIGAYRATTSKATPEDIAELHDHLNGTRPDSRIIGQMHRTGRTAALRHIISNNNRNIDEDSYDSSMEDDMESGMRNIAAQGAVQPEVETRQTSMAALERTINKHINSLSPVDAYIVKTKFGLGDLQHGYKEQDIAAQLNKRSIPSPDDNGWTSDNVKARLNATLAMIKEHGKESLLGFLKSIQDLHTLRKSSDAEWKFNKVCGQMELAYLVKSHIKEYTRGDGTVVQAHDDRRMKHDHIGAHELSHGEQVHTGAKLKHGQELMDHLKDKGWKHKEVSAVRSNGKEAGDKKAMPKPPEIKGANKENSALKSAQSVINKMHEAASKHQDPSTYLKHITTSRSNPYLKAVDDYRTALLNHFGYDVDHDTKDQRYEKDGHVVTLSEKDGKHTVEHAGYEEKGEKESSVNPTKDTLTQAIAKLGGLNSAEAKKQFDLTGKDFPDIKSALKKDGLDPDKMAELLSQHGYIKEDANGKHDYDDFQDKLRRAATGEKVYSVQRDQKDVEDELAQQEKEYIESRGIDDPSSEAVGFEDLHEEAKKEYASVYEEALDVLGKEATNKLVELHQYDVPFDTKNYVDAQLRRAIDEHQGHGKRGNDSKAGTKDAAGGSGQDAAVNSADDTGKGAKPAAGTEPASKPEGERPRSGAGADAVTFSKLKAAVEKFDPSFRYTDSRQSPDVKAGTSAENDIIRMAKQLYKMDPQRTLAMLGTTGIFEHQIAPQKVTTPKPESISSLEALLGKTKDKEPTSNAGIKPDLNFDMSPDLIRNYATVGSRRDMQGKTVPANQYDYEYKVMPVSKIKPSQTGDDYINDSSKETARIHKQWNDGKMTHDDIHYSGDFKPIIVDEDNNILDGNHRHAAHTMNGWKNMRVLVAKKGGTGKVTGLPTQKSMNAADPKHLRKSINHVAYIRRTKSGGTASIAEKGSPRERNLSANHEEARQYVARMWRHGAEESDILDGLHKQYGIKSAHAAELPAEHKRNKGM